MAEEISWLEPLKDSLPRLGRTAPGTPTQSPPESSPTTEMAGSATAWNGSTYLSLSREEMQSVLIAREDTHYRKIYPNLVCPSWRYHGREAACTRCRDLGYVSVLVNAQDDRGGNRLIPCECSAQLAGDRRASAIAGEEMGRVMRFEAFRTDWRDTDHDFAMTASLEACRSWAEGQGPPWVALIGVPGCGKTFLAVAALRRLAERGVENAWYEAGHLVMLLRAGMGGGEAQALADSARDNLLHCPALAMDDYGIERHTAWADSELETFLSVRYQRRLRTLITANSLAHLSERLQSRIQDRTVCALPDLSQAKDVRQWL